jgi:hydrogenase-4 component B
MSLLIVLAAACICGSSGIPPLLAGRSSNRAQILSAFLSAAGSVLGLSGVAVFLSEDRVPLLTLPWNIPGGSFSVALDGLSALFLVPVFLISGLGAVYGLAYWPQSVNPRNGRKLRCFYGLLAGSMALLLLARSSVLFLVSWEAMALSAYFLVATDDRPASARRAAWVYLVATHVGTVALLALFILLRQASGSLEWARVDEASAWPLQSSAVFLLAVVGFGLKAGIMPFHVWLPAAHASAPSHVSGLLSGVMIKMGIYGILRVCSYLPRPPTWWGALLIALGAASAIVGVASAIGQRDLKRMLAYSSIENVGIITLGIGLALLGRALGAAEWEVLGLGGALFHVLNHGLFKPLLFFSAGSVIHAAHTREIDALGGLARPMPITFLAFASGSWAICGLPVFNGFASEILIYLGLIRAATSENIAVCLLASMAAAALALVGALSVACFVRAAGAIFLGTRRCDGDARTTEAPAGMTSVMVILAAACLLLGVAPFLPAALLDRAVGAWAGGVSLRMADLAPLWQVGLSSVAVLVAALAGALFLRRRSAARPRDAEPIGTWDCGYADSSSPRVQYTASSTGQALADLFGWAARRDVRRPLGMEPFPSRQSFESRPTEPLLDGWLNPFCSRWAERFSRLRILQRGNIQVYLIYILLTLLIATVWAALGPEGAR